MVENKISLSECVENMEHVVRAEFADVGISIAPTTLNVQKSEIVTDSISDRIEKQNKKCIEKFTSVLGFVKSEALDLEAEINRLNDRAQELEKNRDSINSDFFSLSAQAEKILSDLDVEKQKLNNAEQMVGNANSKIGQLESEIYSLTLEISNANRNHSDSIERLTGEIKSLEAKKAGYESELAKKKQEIEEAEGKIKCFFDGGLLTALKGEDKKLREKLAEYSNELNSLNSTTPIGRAFTSLCSIFTDAITPVGTAVEKMNKNIGKTQNQIEILGKIISDIENGINITPANEKYLPKDLQIELAALRNGLKDLNNENSKLDKEVSDANVKLGSVEKELSKTRRNEKALSKKNKKLELRINGLKKLIEQAKINANEYKKAYEELDEKIDEKDEELEAKNNEITKLEEKKRGLDRELAKVKNNVQEMLNGLKIISGKTREIAIGQMLSLRTAIKALPSNMIPNAIKLCIWVGDGSVNSYSFPNSNNGTVVLLTGAKEKIEEQLENQIIKQGGLIAIEEKRQEKLKERQEKLKERREQDLLMQLNNSEKLLKNERREALETAKQQQMEMKKTLLHQAELAKQLELEQQAEFDDIMRKQMELDRQLQAELNAEKQKQNQQQMELERVQYLNQQNDNRINEGRMKLSMLVDDAINGVEYNETQSNSDDLLRFCKIMENVYIEPTNEYNQTREGMMEGVGHVLGGVIDKIVEKFKSLCPWLGVGDEVPEDMREDINSISETVASLIKSKHSAMWSEFVNFASEGHSYVACFNKITKLTQKASTEMKSVLDIIIDTNKTPKEMLWALHGMVNGNQHISW
ncbi:MAG: hypothetical protein LBB18_03025 [Puniceicoccales bacterium]|jgi:hypothetical protein|nr:hypothetical protein [Puniceicoccales bacterium]